MFGVGFGCVLFYHLILASEMAAATQAESSVSAKTGIWQRVNLQCLNNSQGDYLLRESRKTKLACLATAMAIKRVPVELMIVQWSSDTGVCSVYEYARIYNLIIEAINTALLCTVYRIWPTTDSVTKLFGQNFTAMWLFDSDARGRNLLAEANSTKNQFYPINIQWTNEGAALDGTTSYMVLNDSQYMNFDNGLTWLLQLKRQPRLQAIIESVDCNDHSISAGHIWEYDAITELSYNTFFRMTRNQAIFTNHPGYAMPNDANKWTNIGITVSGTDSGINVFVDGSFLPDAYVTRGGDPGTGFANYCFLLGYRLGVEWRLQGTVRALAIANKSMSESEIETFFWSLPAI